MAEIKSTMDLVMERTKNMVQSDDDKQKTLEKERENKARSLMLKLVEGLISPKDVPQALDEMEPGEGAAVRLPLLKLMLENLSFERDSQVPIQTIEILTESLTDGPEKISAIFQDYQNSVSELVDTCSHNIREKFHEKGISGPAIQPKLDQDPDYNQALNELQFKFKERLDNAKSELLAVAS